MNNGIGDYDVDHAEKGHAQQEINHQNGTHGFPDLKQVHTTITLSPEQFEKLYLAPIGRHQPTLAKKFGNPTPLAIASFVLTTTPVSCALMGWRGAGNNGVAVDGAMVFLGGTMLAVSGLLEFVLGNTFPFVVFCSFGGFWLTFGCTLQASFGAAAPYSTSGTNTAEGLASAGFMSTFGFLLLAMDLLVVIYAICATRTNAVFFTVFLSLIVVFSLLTGSFWRLALGDTVVGMRLYKVSLISTCYFLVVGKQQI
ncbi:hypothetical protein LTS17_000607 [Exophiala oligosperma]